MLYFSYIQHAPSQKQPKILSANYIPEYSGFFFVLFIEIALVCFGVNCNNNTKYVFDCSDDSRDDERG